VLVSENQFDGVYNLGMSEAYDFNTASEVLNDEFGTDIEIEYIENPIPDSVYVHVTCTDYSKVQADTGWKPQISFEGESIGCVDGSIVILFNRRVMYRS
jgi:UDP-glucose 4-epimerase